MYIAGAKLSLKNTALIFLELFSIEWNHLWRHHL